MGIRSALLLETARFSGVFDELNPGYFIGILNGGASRDRTDGLVVANDALSQLSYSPILIGKVDSNILAAIRNRYHMAGITKIPLTNQHRPRLT
jgi:hypothetical protein